MWIKKYLLVLPIKHIISDEICVALSLLRLLDAYRLRQKRRIPALCVTYSNLNDDQFLWQNVGLGTQTYMHWTAVSTARGASRARKSAAKVTSAKEVLSTSGVRATAMDMYSLMVDHNVSYGFDKHLYLTSCLNAHKHNTCIRLPQTDCTARKMTLFIGSQDCQTQVLAANAMQPP